MPAKRKASFQVKRIICPTDPIVEITGEGTAAYIWFNRHEKYARTISKSTWPVLNIDVSENGKVIGIETVGFKEFTITSVLEKARLKAPASLASRARYIHGEAKDLIPA